MVIKLELPLEIVFIIYCWLFKGQFWETIMTLQYEPGVVHEFFLFNSCTCGVVESPPSLLFCLIFFVAIQTIFSFHLGTYLKRPVIVEEGGNWFCLWSVIIWLLLTLFSQWHRVFILTSCKTKKTNINAQQKEAIQNTSPAKSKPSWK